MTDSAHPGSALELEGVTRVYGSTGTEVRALDGVTLRLPPGSFTAVMGPSGSGKSTLLNCAAGLDRPTEGSVTVQGRSLAGLSDDQLTRFRRAHLGFVFQAFNLLPYLTAYQNVELPLRLAGRRVDRRAVVEALAEVSIDGRAHHLPAELSGGQQQRVAVARAMVARPAVLFADEPTGALDSVAARAVLDLLRQAADRRGQTIVMVTHDPVAAARADSVVFLADGRLVGTMAAPTADAVAGQLAHLGELTAVSR
ncbi:ABC transporter ATP-binding protein [Modestobacter versicolor]|uniref:ABC transporter ATP-binding protein n=1 Tax=Modestobacter versicolor TaxID=429133 RepID=A0A323VVE1_9ACTN|nr:ABC transporter ATP-binding protein [Modestobacter versicolor]MBB3676308.1 putative ABC transport system ATP-binding protein [Modestobacter versicolor]PZA22768.1 ABC transporter ATP-binding protein [Modestobacter versicolor]